MGIVTPFPACGFSRIWLARPMQKIGYEAIWLYLCFTLSLRDVEDLLAGSVESLSPARPRVALSRIWFGILMRCT